MLDTIYDNVKKYLINEIKYYVICIMLYSFIDLINNNNYIY